MTSNIQTIKVKVYYTLRESKSTRLTTFTIPNNEEIIDHSTIPVPLKTCLWSICSSSPDMICKDHDLCIYTANFHESGHGPSEKRDSLIWEGHGLMAWIMDQSRNEIYVYGKSNHHETIDIYIELQPTMKWVKDDFFSALKSKSFEQLRTSTQTPNHPLCNCYYNTEDPYLRTAVSSPKGNETEFDRYLRHRPQPFENASPPLPSRLPALSKVPVFRPEPIFPSSNTSSSSTSNNKRSRMASSSSNYYSKQNEDNHGDLTLPIPSQMPYNVKTEPTSRRSAFTIPSLADTKEQSKARYFPPSSSTSSTSTSSSPTSNYGKPLEDLNNSNNNSTNNPIPVIYTTSNKKRKKNLSGSEASSSTTNRQNAMYNSNNSMQQQTSLTTAQHQQPSSAPSSQQVNTAPRTYYEVDRDTNGAYILPVEIDSWTVVDLGTVIYDRPAYHNQRYIYPANYTVRKWYRSMVDPKSDTQYTCRILENGREPKFEVTADDCPMTYSGPTPTTVWTIIVRRRAFAIRNQEYGHNPVGPDFFGLRKNTIAKMIQDLPNAAQCSQYVWQTFEPARFNKPGRSRRRADSTLPGSLLGGVNYGLTSSRLHHNTNLTATQQSYRAITGTSSSPPPPASQQQSPKKEPTSPSLNNSNPSNSSRPTTIEPV